MSTLIYNANIYVERGVFAEALLVGDDGKIAAVGTEAEVRAAANGNETEYDAGGRTIVPGFNDSHQHLFNTGIALAAVRLQGVTSIQEVIERSRRYIEENQPQPGEVIHGMGWNQDYFTDEHRLLTRHDLDKISTEHPIIFDRACGHILTCNTKALEMAGITTETVPNAGGAIDQENGELTGVFRENARAQVRCLMSERSLETKKRLLRTAIRHANETGVTSVQTCDVRLGDWESTLQAYEEVLNETPTVRAYHQFSFMEPKGFQAFLDKGYRTGTGNDFNRIGPLKLFVDGSLGARTALMRKPYADDPTTCGIATLTEEEIDTLVGMAVKNNCGVAIHAIGDAAVENVLNAYDKVCNGTNPLRLGIVHVQITDRPLLERFTKNDILALVQPIFLHYDTGIVEDRVGKELAATSYAFKTLVDLGVHTSFGTDSPVEDMDPIANIYCAVTRKNLRGEPEGGFHPEECLDIYQAVDAYTIESAYASFDEKVKGRLMKGYFADLLVLSDNIFTVASDDILKVKVDATMVNGRFVYERA